MSTAAYMLKRGFTPAVGLDRTHCTELWHVTGIVGWTRANTAQTVFAAIAPSVGKAHDDPLIANAICTSIYLADGPAVSQDNAGTMEAIVAVVYDSNRTWGAGGYFESGMFSAAIEIEVPSFCAVAGNGHQRNDFRRLRTIINRIDPRNATGITEAQKAIVAQAVGKRFNVYSVDYILAAAPIRRLPTNQTIIEYTFLSKSSIPAFPASLPNRSVAINALAVNEEYIVSQTSPPTIGKQTAAELYGNQNYDPTNTLPYWDRRLVP